MREFKFRIWDKARRRMSQWEEMKENWNLHVFVTSDEDLEIMQYTGLKDRNGQEIYEGDILEAIDIELEDGFFIGGYAGYVEWDVPAFVFKSGKNGEYTDPLDHTDECYVIGNIYENPELLR